MSFSQDITKFVAKTGLRADVVLRKLAFDAFHGIQLRSRVDTGRFRASHRIGINKPDLSVEPPRKKKASVPQGSAVGLSAAQRKLASAKFGQVIYITNNLPYAKPLEDRFRAYALSFEELVTKFAATVRSVK